MSLRAESKKHQLLAELSRADGALATERSAAAKSLLAWFNEHTKSWWPPEDPRAAIAMMPNSRGLDSRERTVLLRAFRHVHPVSAESLTVSGAAAQSVEVKGALEEIVDASERKRLRDRLKDQLRTHVAAATARSLGADTGFLRMFGDSTDQSDAIRTAARGAAQATEGPVVEEVLNKQSVQSAGRAYLHDDLERSYAEARRRQSLPPENLTAADVEAIGSTLGQLTDGRYGPPIEALSAGGPDGELIRARAFDLIALHDRFSWGLPPGMVEAEEALLTVHQKQIENSLRKALGHSADADRLSTDVLGELWERMRRHTARSFIVDGTFPSQQALEAWSNKARKELTDGALAELREEQASLIGLPEDVEQHDELESSFVAPAFISRCQYLIKTRPTMYSPEDLVLVLRAVASGKGEVKALAAKATARRATKVERRAACLLLDAAGSADLIGGDQVG